MTIELAPGLILHSRSDWRADSNFPRRGHRVERDQRTHVIIHHTVMTDRSDSSPNIWETDREIYAMMRKLQVVRKNDLGADVPYNFVAFLQRSGQLAICEGRGEARTGAHTKGHNPTGIAVAFAGNFEDVDIEAIEIYRCVHLLSLFLGWLKSSASHPDYGTYAPMENLCSLRPRDRAVFFHQDFKATACPGTQLMRFMSMVDPIWLN